MFANLRFPNFPKYCGHKRSSANFSPQISLALKASLQSVAAASPGSRKQFDPSRLILHLTHFTKNIIIALVLCLALPQWPGVLQVVLLVVGTDSKLNWRPPYVQRVGGRGHRPPRVQAHLWVVLEHDDEVLADEEKVHVGGEEGVGKALWARSAGPPLLHRSSQWTRGGRDPAGEAVWPRPRCSSQPGVQHSPSAHRAT